MLYLIGLGLKDGDIAVQGREALRDADVAFAELYTNSVVYDLDALQDETGTRITVLDRSAVEEQDRVLDAAHDQDVAFLVSGDPLAATTHQDVLFRARTHGIETRVIHAPSIFTAVAETGLSIYKFGRTTTLPEPYNDQIPDSPFEVVATNQEQGLHTLLLLDIGMTAEDALSLVADRVPDPIFVCARLGTGEEQILYGSIEALKPRAGDLSVPCCLIIPGDLSDNERERIERWQL